VTTSSHKIGGPFGVGALVVDPRVGLTPVLHGGGQEREVRSGTLDAAGIAGFAVAVEHAVSGQAARAAQLEELRETLIAGIRGAVPEAVINGDVAVGPDHRLPGNVHASFPGCEGDLLLMLLDAAGVDCSTGSACTAGIPEPSHVLLAMGVPDDLARASLRFSFGETSSRVDVDAVLAALPGAVDRARRAGSLAPRPA
jgi:cysteine desulfurase